MCTYTNTVSKIVRRERAQQKNSLKNKNEICVFHTSSCEMKTNYYYFHGRPSNDHDDNTMIHIVLVHNNECECECDRVIIKWIWNNEYFKCHQMRHQVYYLYIRALLPMLQVNSSAHQRNERKPHFLSSFRLINFFACTRNIFINGFINFDSFLLQTTTRTSDNGHIHTGHWPYGNSNVNVINLIH